MKLAFSSNAYMHFSIEETIRKIAELGYTGIEVLADVPAALELKLACRAGLEFAQEDEALHGAA